MVSPRQLYDNHLSICDFIVYYGGMVHNQCILEHTYTKNSMFVVKLRIRGFVWIFEQSLVHKTLSESAYTKQ